MALHAHAGHRGNLRDRVPGHSLIEKLLSEWRVGRIRVEGETVVIDDRSLGWYWGVFGERRTGEALAGLDESWHVLHSVPVGVKGRDIDHIAIGPSGVYVINTKDHRGRTVWAAGYGVMIGEQKKPGYITSLLHDVELTAERLSTAAGMAVPVHGVLCLIDPARIRITSRPGSAEQAIHVVAVDRLLATFAAHRRELSDEQVARIATAASDPFTWLNTVETTQSGAGLAREFDALSAELGPLLDRRHAPFIPASAPRKRQSTTAPNDQVPRRRSSSAARARSAGRTRRRSSSRTTREGILALVFLGMAAVAVKFGHPLLAALLPHR